jgi:hypothetical protein
MPLSAGRRRASRAPALPGDPAGRGPALPVRGPEARRLGLALPPARMPPWRRHSALKRWRYVGVYTRELMLCAGEAWIGPVPRRWWAVAEPDGTLHGHASAGRAGLTLAESRVRVESADVSIDLRLEDADPVEIVSPAGARGNYVWTAKAAGVAVRGEVHCAAREYRIDGPHAFIDESAGYHPRHTAWKWSAGHGWAEDGRHVGWNLVAGIHDAAEASERTVWIDGVPRELGPVRFAADLSELAFAEGGALGFEEWAAREEHLDLWLVRSTYRQPFGVFSGELPGGVRLAEGHGVMEDHDVLW